MSQPTHYTISAPEVQRIGALLHHVRQGISIISDPAAKEIRETLAALQPVPDPGEAPEEIEAGWWCPNCQQMVDGSAVTCEEYHDPRAGGCGAKVGNPPKVRPAPDPVTAPWWVVLGPTGLAMTIENSKEQAALAMKSLSGMYPEAGKLSGPVPAFPHPDPGEARKLLADLVAAQSRYSAASNPFALDLDEAYNARQARDLALRAAGAYLARTAPQDSKGGAQP